MFKIILFSTVSMFASMQVMAEKDVNADTDGCFQTYKPEAIGVVVCVSGSSNEGLSGEGTEVAILSQTGEVAWCAKTTGVKDHALGKLSKNHKSFLFDRATGMNKIVFDGEATAEKEQSGKITFDEVEEDSEYSYKILNKKDTTRLMVIVQKSRLCEEAKGKK